LCIVNCRLHENGRLKYIRAKTGKHYNIKILAPALEILNWYLEHYPESEYIFPILDQSKHKTATQKDNRITKISKEVNKDLKEIALKAEIDFNITFYVARHSWATILKRSGVSTSVISEAMKHDTERTTQIYLDSFENDILDEANENLLK
jgi:integrase